MRPPQEVTAIEPLTSEQLELLPALVEGAEPDAYIVIPVALLSRQLLLSWTAVARQHRGEVRLGWFSVNLMRALQSVGVIVDTKYGPAHPHSSDVTT